MRDKDFNTLEFKKFLENLSEFSPNEITKKEILNLKPTKDEFSLKNKIKGTQEFIDIANYEGYFPLTEYPDVIKSLNLLKIEESILSSIEIKNIATIFSITREIKHFLTPHIRNTEILIRRYKNLYPSRETERIINDSIDSSGSIKDSASKDLAKIELLYARVKNTIKTPEYFKILTDKIIRLTDSTEDSEAKERQCKKICRQIRFIGGRQDHLTGMLRSTVKAFRIRVTLLLLEDQPPELQKMLKNMRHETATILHTWLKMEGK
ncbi:MAG: hypothetical protein L3J71_17815 [Victivallaceae bacterium]|nr:hypothetical protein [Victivallaceae bacterium]